MEKKKKGKLEKQKYLVYLTSSTFCTQGWGYTDSCLLLEREMDTEIQGTVEDTVSGKARRRTI